MLLQINEPGQTKTPQDEDVDVAVGIDLGTTNSLVAISTEEKPSEISDKFGNFITPSVIFLDEKGEFKVGVAEGEYIASAKRLMGKNFDDVKDISAFFGYNIDEKNSDKVINMKIGDKVITPVEFSAKILSKLKLDAENNLKKEVKKAVITVPAYFNDAQRQATKDAAKIAGLEVLRLINEPAAAALAYGLDKGAEGMYAVYDFGGGTFDVSLLKMQMGVFKVIATGGDTSLGGDDIDIALGELIAEKLELQNPDMSFRQKPESKKKGNIDPVFQRDDILRDIKSYAKQIKEELSSNKSCNINILGADIEISLEEFESLAEPIISRTIDIFSNVIDDADIEVEDIKGVILVGGSTRIPLACKKIQELTGKEPLSDIDPDKVVAFGAAIQAEALTKGSENLLLDVTPLSLGIETYGGLMEVLIGRNTAIPASVTQSFTTYEDGQTAMKVHVLQGERELAENCRSLAQFDLKGIPAKPAGTAVVEISFNIDADGILSVSAKEETTGIKQDIEVKPSYGLDSTSMEKMLLASQEQAKEDIFKRLLQEARIEAEVLIKNLESGLSEDKELISGQYFEKIQKQIEKIQTVCKQDDRDLIEYETKVLDELASDFADERISKALKGYLGGKKINEV